MAASAYISGTWLDNAQWPRTPELCQSPDELASLEFGSPFLYVAIARRALQEKSGASRKKRRSGRGVDKLTGMASRYAGSDSAQHRTSI